MCHVNRDSLTHCSQGSVAQLVEQRTSNLNPGNYNHFEVDGAKSKLQYMVS